MSASICWEFVKPVCAKSISTMAPSSFQETCKKVFGAFPIAFSKEDIPKLEVLAALESDDKYQHPFGDILEIILSSNGSIRLWAEY